MATRSAMPGVSVLCLLALVCAGVAASAQGQGAATDAPAEATPRWPDGRVNLGATPQHKGYWEIRPGLGGYPRAAEVPFQPWARALHQFRTSTPATRW
jgi:hypothetical protein